MRYLDSLMASSVKLEQENIRLKQENRELIAFINAVANTHPMDSGELITITNRARELITETEKEIN